MKKWGAFLNLIIKLLSKIFKRLDLRNKNFVVNIFRRFLKSSLRGYQRGFILPIVLFLAVVLALITATVLTRSGNRAVEVIGDKKANIVLNSATPAIERARAKLQYLFSQDPRFSSGLPGDAQLQQMLLNTYPPVQSPNPYNFSDEVQLDVNGDGVLDPAWSFASDINGDGKKETVACVIHSNVTATVAGTTYNRTSNDTNKSASLIVRGGPATLAQQGSSPNCSGSSSFNFSGWDPVSSSNVHRTFQVDAISLSPSDVNNKGAISTLELLQDRQAELGNKWGAWFRYDMEIYPSDAFLWNGAMHTEGNFIATGTKGNASLDPTQNPGIRFYLVSSPASCLYTKTNSEITLAGNADGSVSPSNGIYFLGQLSSGSVLSGSFTGNNVIFDLFSKVSLTNIGTGSYYMPSQIYIMAGNQVNATVNPFTYDSVKSSAVNDPSQLAVDPIALVTQGKNQLRASIGSSTDGTSARDTTNWNSQSLPVKYERIYNSSSTAPYVDDTYRADDRYGPKPKYTQLISIPSSKKVGDSIPTTDPNYTTLTQLSVLNPVSGSGLDGYWERRAWASGLRIVVGQRLELGNTYGWNGPFPTDPLYPATTFASTRAHELKQFKSLRDNLAAVQATAIYHANNANSNGDFPQACLATTAHPGTSTTLTNSTSFGSFLGATGLTKTDFFTGNGTNGWEFDAPSGNSSAQFATNISLANPLGRALRNLAHFAGDPKGAFPAVQETSGSIVHPYPNLMMWGDFSNLRRALKILDAGTSYSNLSLADRTTIQTAACSIGMLAYNINSLQASYIKGLNGVIDTLTPEAYNPTLLGTATPQTTTTIGYIDTNNSSGGSLDKLGQALFSLMDGVNSKQIGLDSSGNGAICTYNSTSRTYSGGTTCPTSTYSLNYFKQFTAKQWLDALNILQGGTASTTLTSTNATMIYARQLLAEIQPYQQVMRDRAYGFASYITNNGNNYYLSPTSGTSTSYNSTTATYTVPTNINANIVANNTLTLFCDPGTFNTTTAGSNIALAEAFCSPGEKPNTSTKYPSFIPKYPALYYIFPIADHYHDGIKGPNVGSATVTYQLASQPSAEPYVSDTYISGSAVNGNSSNSGYVYSSVQGGGVNIAIDGTTSSNQVSISPRAQSSWQLPYSTNITSAYKMFNSNGGSTTISGLTVTRSNVITTGSTPVAVSFLDRGIFNARELLATRVLDLDLDLLRNSNSNLSSDYWLPKSGIIYAFREDAMREDGIARPSSASYTSCDTVVEVTTNSSCYMNAVSTSNPVDPPNYNVNGISIKPVDFFPDPDRRVDGFRLNNGLDIRRPLTANDPDYLNGITFVTDNPLYIKAQPDYCQIANGTTCSGNGNGAFNLHSDATSINGTLTRIEEFTNLLADNWSNFYDTSSTGRATANTKFATANDTWRPVELVADAITILSQNFIDGTIDNGLLTNPYQGSFGQVNFPVSSSTSTTLNNALQLIREDGSVSNSLSNIVPILISKDGAPVYCNTSTTTCLSSNTKQFGRESPPGSFLNIILPGYKSANQYEPAPPASSRFNFTAVSGIIPSRINNANGGLHNFPRLLEPWCSPTSSSLCSNYKSLYIAGAFIQLNFSNYATGLFDHDAWEPGSTPSAQSYYFSYYTAPTRAWGYDVGLQIAPAGPLAQRFIAPSNNYSESYRSLSLNDPYIKKLRCASTPKGSITQIDPSASCP
jgi:hypothetical protein